MRLVWLLSAIVSCAACGSAIPATDSSSLSSDEFEKNTQEVKAPPRDSSDNADDESGDDESDDECSVQCFSKKDCCEGYYCGKDPERNPAKDYCLPGG